MTRGVQVINDGQPIRRLVAEASERPRPDRECWRLEISTPGKGPENNVNPGFQMVHHKGDPAVEGLEGKEPRRRDQKSLVSRWSGGSTLGDGSTLFRVTF